MSSSSRSASARSSPSGPSNTGVATTRAWSGRGAAIGCSIRSVSLAEIHLVEPLDPGRGAPTPAESGRIPGLARVRQPCLDLLFDDVADVNLEVRLQARKAPCFGGLMRRAGVWKCQRIPRAGPGGVECDAADYAVIRVIFVASG